MDANKQSHRASKACEVCGDEDSGLQQAHWIARCDGGPTRANNILKLCPNCHNRLDQQKDPDTTQRCKERLLLRSAEGLLSSSSRRDKAMQSEFRALCVSIIERRVSACPISGAVNHIPSEERSTDKAKVVASGGDNEWNEAGWHLYQKPDGSYFKVAYGREGEEVGFSVIPSDHANELLAKHKLGASLVVRT
jgi:HNH endonuclease